jgi:hypothetical protein
LIKPNSSSSSDDDDNDESGEKEGTADFDPTAEVASDTDSVTDTSCWRIFPMSVESDAAAETAFPDDEGGKRVGFVRRRFVMKKSTKIK